MLLTSRERDRQTHRYKKKYAALHSPAIEILFSLALAQLQSSPVAVFCSGDKKGQLLDTQGKGTEEISVQSRTDQLAVQCGDKSEKFGLHAGNMKFNIENEDGINNKYIHSYTYNFAYLLFYTRAIKIFTTTEHFTKMQFTIQGKVSTFLALFYFFLQNELVM